MTPHSSLNIFITFLSIFLHQNQLIASIFHKTSTRLPPAHLEAI